MFRSKRYYSSRALWWARGAVLLVWLSNLSAAVPYILWPERYLWAFEVQGVAGEVLVRSIGLLFVMWVVPYVPVILHPLRHRSCHTVIIIQQLLGLAGESWILATLPPGHPALRNTGGRFVLFDLVGLLLLLVPWLLLRRRGDEGPKRKPRAGLKPPR